MFNKVILVGRLVSEPNDSRITNIAVDAGKDKKGNQRTDFIPLIFGEKKMESIGQYLEKGRLVLIEGRAHSYKSKDNHSHIIVAVNNVQFLSSKKSEDSKDSDDDIFS